MNDPKKNGTGQIDVETLLKQLENQQKLIGELQVRLHHSEETAANLDNRVFQMRTLLQSGKGFSQILNLQSLLDAFMSVCRERYASINSVVLLLDDLDPQSTFYRVRAYYGLPDRFPDPRGVEEDMCMFKIPHDQGLLWQLIHQGNVFAVRDMRKLPRFDTAFKRWNLNLLRSDVWVPLLRGSDVLGILTLGECEDGTQIPESDYSFLEEIAAVAATNIDSTLKYEKNGRILNNLRTLYDINQQLANVNDFKKLIQETLTTAVEALSAQKANLMILDHDTGRLQIKVMIGNIPDTTLRAINDGEMETKSFSLGEGVAGQAAETRKPVRLNDRTKIEQVGRNTVYCILSVPIIYANEVEGVITLTNKVKRDETGETVLDPLGRFGEEDQQLLASLADQAAVNLKKARLYNASITDRVTRLGNTRHFETRLVDSLKEAGQQNSTVCLAVVDIDHFKQFNDEYGHRAGDFVLKRTAEILKEVEDLGYEVFRYGGEEFCILMTGTTLDDAVPLMEQVREKVAATEVDWNHQKLSVTISIGVASSVDHPDSLALFEHADKALYSAKENGRNRVSSTPKWMDRGSHPIPDLQ